MALAHTVLDARASSHAGVSQRNSFQESYQHLRSQHLAIHHQAMGASRGITNLGQGGVAGSSGRHQLRIAAAAVAGAQGEWHDCQLVPTFSPKSQNIAVLQHHLLTSCQLLLC